MQDSIKLVQGNIGFLMDHYIIYTAEGSGILLQADLLTGTIEILEKDVLQNNIIYITAIDDVVYAVDRAGKWVSEVVPNRKEIVYYKTNYKSKKSYGIFLAVRRYSDKIYMFLKDEAAYLLFDAKTKEIVKHRLDLPTVKGGSFEWTCVKDEYIWLFSGKQGLCAQFDLKKGYIRFAGNIPKIGNVVYAFATKENMFLLSENTVYEFKEGEITRFFSAEAPFELGRMCVTEKNIWLLPGKGREIYMYSLDSRKIYTYTDYPDDLEYVENQMAGQYSGCCEDDKYIYWMMWTNNYFLKISKKTGEGTWIKPRGIHERLLCKKAFESKKILNETRFSLGQYLRYLTN